MNWLLIVIVAIIAVCAFAGWRIGFIKTVFSLVSTIVVIVVTLIFSPVVTSMLKGNESFVASVNEKVSMVVDLSKVESKDGTTSSFIDGLSLPDSMKDAIKEKNEEASGYVDAKREEIEIMVCDYLTGIIINAIGFFVTFLVASVAMVVLCFVLNIISKLPVLHQINTTAGAAAGALEGLVIVWIFFIVITMLGSSEFGQDALGMISESPVLSFLYDHNVLSGIIMK